MVVRTRALRSLSPAKISAERCRSPAAVGRSAETLRGASPPHKLLEVVVVRMAGCMI
jgi:hypothetical protein